MTFKEWGIVVAPIPHRGYFKQQISVNKQKKGPDNEKFSSFKVMSYLKVIILSVNSHCSKILGGGKVNQLGYVASHQ